MRERGWGSILRAPGNRGSAFLRGPGQCGVETGGNILGGIGACCWLDLGAAVDALDHTILRESITIDSIGKMYVWMNKDPVKHL